ncbi:putative necrosis-inducing factor-domain-containing protein [Cladorrhinum sp. PSN332]|nr:putative necrosis-inducing factor-domain-containing protein [Cladorrhinum sp. PSN332]
MFLSDVLLASVVFFATLISCAPANTTHLLFNERACGPYTVDNHGSLASPLVSDCRQIMANIADNPTGYWTIDIDQQRTILRYGSCAFGITTDQMVVGISYLDVTDIITDSINQYQFKREDHQWRVGTGGSIVCENIDSGATWGLYHTK